MIPQLLPLLYTHTRIPCLISALLMPTLPTPETGPELERVATAVLAATTAPEVGADEGGYIGTDNIESS